MPALSSRCSRGVEPLARGPIRTRRRDQRGAALVEFALVVPIFALLLMGIIDFGNAFNDYNSVRQGVREGARQAVVARWDASGCSGTSSQKTACLTKQRIGLDEAQTRVRIELGSEYKAGEDVTVCAMVQARSITGMFSGILDNRTLRSKITMRIEQVNADAELTDFADTALPNQDWTWC